MKVGNDTLRGLFEVERESHCQAMRDALLILEKSPADSAQLEKLMRAAHSLKGAAKLVNCEEVVRDAHLLESGVVAAQEENRLLSPAEFDKYFDLVATMTGKPREKEILFQPEIAELSSQFARVELTVMDGLLRLAGEMLVQENRLQLENSTQRELGNFTQKMNAILKSLSAGSTLDVAELSQQAISLLNSYEEQESQRYEHFEQNRNRSYHLAQRLYRETLRSRMRPLSDLTAPLPEFCRSVSRALGKEVSLVLNNQDTLIDRDLLKQLEIPFQQLLKNAIDHGIEASSVRLSAEKPSAGTLTIRANQNSDTLTIVISDDGMGISTEMLRQKIVQRGLATHELAETLNVQELYEFIFLLGFSSRDQVTEYSGRGVGLDIVREQIRLLRGTVTVSSVEGKGSEFVITLPVSLSVQDLLRR